MLERSNRRWRNLRNSYKHHQVMETNTLLIFAISLVASILFFISQSRGKELKESRLREDNIRKQLDEIQLKLNEAYRDIPIMASQQFDEFKRQEIGVLREILAESAKESAVADLETWKIQHETFYRQDAINRSKSVILGKVTEHLIPFQENFPFNPKEARFIGSPIDMIVFDGIDNEDEVDIYILEIKTGNSSLNKRQRLIRDAVINQRVHWRELNV
jgi:predicted Holliday junction resolvase-like endonuclease